MSARETILRMTDPVSQRYAFCRYVLGEPRMDACAIAGGTQQYGLMDGRDLLEALGAAGAPRDPDPAR